MSPIEHAADASLVRILGRDIERVSVDAVESHPRNPNVGNLDVIVESMRSNGFYGALIVQRSTNYILAGNHRWRAARQLEMETVPVIYVDIDDEAALRILLADNRTSELSHRDPTALLALLDEMSGTEQGLYGVGFDLDAVEALRTTIAEASDSGDIDDADGFGREFTETLTVAVREPSTAVHSGEVYALGDLLTLCVMNPIEEMTLILPYLSPASRFLPFAGGFVSHLVTARHCVVAQPNLYIAAFIIDRWRESHGDSGVRKLA